MGDILGPNCEPESQGIISVPGLLMRVSAKAHIMYFYLVRSKSGILLPWVTPWLFG